MQLSQELIQPEEQTTCEETDKLIPLFRELFDLQHRQGELMREVYSLLGRPRLENELPLDCWEIRLLGL